VPAFSALLPGATTPDREPALPPGLLIRIPLTPPRAARDAPRLF